jgi:aspartyl-tRNA(Asn)/glutamyl-tRNA(Gln) amidotransferase subunit C
MSKAAAINESLTRQVASLSRLELTDEEVKLFTAQLGEVVKYIDQLQAVDVTGVEPLTHALDHLITDMPALREDVLEEFPFNANGSPKTLDAAPESLDGGFKVPPII